MLWILDFRRWLFHFHFVSRRAVKPLGPPRKRILVAAQCARPISVDVWSGRTLGWHAWSRRSAHFLLQRSATRGPRASGSRYGAILHPWAELRRHASQLFARRELDRVRRPRARRSLPERPRWDGPRRTDRTWRERLFSALVSRWKVDLVWRNNAEPYGYDLLDISGGWRAGAAVGEPNGRARRGLVERRADNRSCSLAWPERFRRPGAADRGFCHSADGNNATVGEFGDVALVLRWTVHCSHSGRSDPAETLGCR